MRQLLVLAKKQVGLTTPNPVTAAAVVHNDSVISWGIHHGIGLEHAEVVALKQAGSQAKGATLYVNLEPCSHFGKTPPCTDYIIQSGIKRVVYAVKDLNPIVRRKSARDILEHAGIDVNEGLLEKEAFFLNDVFFKTITTQLPFVTLKIGMSLDGRITHQKQLRSTITCEKSHRAVHKLRREVDAIIVGVQTVIVDDPQLTVRYGLLSGKDGNFQQPLRIVLDTSGRLPLTSLLLTDSYRSHTFVFVGDTIPSEKFDSLSKFVHIKKIPVSHYGLDWTCLLKELYTLGIRHVLIEGGQQIITSAIQSGIVDKLKLFMAPTLIGAKGLSFFMGETLYNNPHLLHLTSQKIDSDLVIDAYFNSDLWNYTKS